MTAEDLDIHPDSLAAAEGRLSDCGDRLGRAVRELHDHVLGAGSPWGSDELGTIFSEAYTSCTTTGLDSFSHIAGHLTDIGQALGQMGQNTQDTDRATASGFDSALPGGH